MSGLNEWKKRVGEQEAQRIVTEAAGVGTALHNNLEKFLAGEKRVPGNNLVHVQANKMADIIIENGMSNVDEVWAIEQSLCFPGLYAGTADMICVHRNKPVIGDFKTSRKVKKREWIEDYFMQCAAYALAHNELYGTNIDSGLIFIVSHSGEYQEFTVEGAEFQKYTDQWLNKVEQYYKAN